MSTVSRIIIAVLIGFLVLVVCGAVTTIVILARSVESPAWEGAITHTTMLILSLILIYLFSKGKVSTYGLKSVSLKCLGGPILVGAIVSGVLYAVGNLLSLNGEPDFLQEFSLLQIMVLICVYASIAEEFLTRGFLLGFLAPLAGYRVAIYKFYISLPVLVAALFFGLMHVVLLTSGVTYLSVLFIVLSAIILGIIAGYYREKTGSLIPAIIVHMLFNAWGVVTKLLEKGIS